MSAAAAQYKIKAVKDDKIGPAGPTPKGKFRRYLRCRTIRRGRVLLLCVMGKVLSPPSVS